MTVLADMPLQARLNKLPRNMSRPAALAAGLCICASVERTCADYKAMGRLTDEVRFSVRQAGINAMDNIWYECISDRTRASFNYDRNVYYTACGWPE